jgi:hypothetical protein
MASYTLKKTQIPLDEGWDVVVVGGGPAGCAAAAAAAREGAKTLLIEVTGVLGGMGTAGLVPAWSPFSDKQRIIYGGLAETVFRAARRGVPHVPEKVLDWVPINPELLKRVYDDLLAEHGATVLFHTHLAAAETDDAGRCRVAVAANKAGLTAVAAKIFVDATGDADLAAWAGAEWQKGTADGGEMQPATLCFILSNVDTYGWSNLLARHGGQDGFVQHILKPGKYPRIRDPHLCQAAVGPDTVGFNAGHLWGVDGTDPQSVSAAMAEGRKLAADLRDALAEFAPEVFGASYLVATAPLMGIRETRRILGHYVLTLDDWLARRSFDDEIARNAYWIDIHTAAGEIEQAKQQTDLVVRRYEHYGPGESHGIPYRCLTPRGLANVLVAGRAISVDRPVQGSVRTMPPCLATGEAAGVAAAFAARHDVPDVHAVDAGALRRRLREHQAYLP